MLLVFNFHVGHPLSESWCPLFNFCSLPTAPSIPLGTCVSTANNQWCIHHLHFVVMVKVLVLLKVRMSHVVPPAFLSIYSDSSCWTLTGKCWYTLLLSVFNSSLLSSILSLFQPLHQKVYHPFFSNLFSFILQLIF